MGPEGSLSCSLVPILNQMYQARSTHSCFFKIQFNIILPPTFSILLVISFLLDFPQKSYMYFSSRYAYFMPCPSHPPWLDHSNYTWRRVKVMKLLIMQFFLTFYHFISLWYKYSPQHHVHCSSLNIVDQVSHPYKTARKIIVLVSIVFIRQEVLNWMKANIVRIHSVLSPSYAYAW
jgi:hypothetical protein